MKRHWLPLALGLLVTTGCIGAAAEPEPTTSLAQSVTADGDGGGPPSVPPTALVCPVRDTRVGAPLPSVENFWITARVAFCDPAGVPHCVLPISCRARYFNPPPYNGPGVCVGNCFDETYPAAVTYTVTDRDLPWYGSSNARAYCEAMASTTGATFCAARLAILLSQDGIDLGWLAQRACDRAVPTKAITCATLPTASTQPVR